MSTVKGYSYSGASSTVIQNGEVRQVVQEHYEDTTGRKEDFQKKVIKPKDGDTVVMKSVLTEGDQVKKTMVGVEDDEKFDELWNQKQALPGGAEPAKQLKA